MPKKEHFKNQYCQFTPAGWVILEDGITYPLTFKVVTKNMQSLGLRHNPNIITYKSREWTKLPEDRIVPGNDDWGGWGGIWSALRLGGARHLLKDHPDYRIFLTAVFCPLFANSYRIKSSGVFLMEEIS